MNHSFAHVVSYVTGGLGAAIGFVAHLDPALITAVVGASAAPYVGPAIVLAGALVNAAHGFGLVGSKPAAVSVSPTVKALAVLGLAGLLSATTAGLLTGCATVAKVDAAVTSPAAQPTITLVAEGAVLAAEAKGVSAAQINVIAKAALAADSGVTASLGAVDTAVNAAAEKANLPTQYWPLIQLFENAVTETVASKVGNNATVAATQAAVADVLNAIIAASGG